MFCPICINWCKSEPGEWECGHSGRCPLFPANLYPLLRGLHKGIKTWAADEDGVPEEMWEDWVKLGEIVRDLG